MTLHEISNQLYDLSLGHFINSEKYTRRGLETAIRMWMRNVENNKIKNSHVLEICLPDGRWLMTIDKIANRVDGYDYYIPDTREQEQRILDALHQ